MPLDAGFLSMLTHTAVWQAVTGTDQWGNETYAAPVTIQCFVTEQGARPGDTTSDSQEKTSVWEATVLTDSLGIGINDKVIVAGHTGYVTDVDTPKDEDGTDLMHTIKVTETRRG